MPPIIAKIIAAVVIKILIGVFWELYYQFRDNPEFREAVVEWYTQSIIKLHAVLHPSAFSVRRSSVTRRKAQTGKH